MTLYFDAASWSSGLTAFAFVPWFWWTLRRCARGELTPLIPFVAGYLAMTAGNPYGALGACLAVVGCASSSRGARRWAPVRRTLLGGIAVGLVAPLTYLPLVLTQSVTYRNGSNIGNSGLMVPGLGDLLNASTPSFAAWVDAFEHPYLTVPATYLAWYALPLLPWLRYHEIVDALSSRMAVPVYTVIGLAFSVGPSEAWMFRWPLRVVPFFVLPTAILLAIALAQGLARDYRGRRAAGSVLVILGGAYLAEATRPDLVYAHLASVLLVGALTAAAVAVWLRWPDRPAASAVLLAGCVAVLTFQVAVFPRNKNLNDYRFPTNVATTSAALVPRYPGTVLQVANNGAVVHSPDPSALTSEVMFGNMLQAVGVQAVTSYYGMGFKAYTDVLCIEFNGSVCPDALRRAWAPPAPGAPPLADLLRLETVVVQNGLPGVADVPVSAGLASRRAHRRGDRAAPGRRAAPPAGQAVGRAGGHGGGRRRRGPAQRGRPDHRRPRWDADLRPAGLARLHRPHRRRELAVRQGPAGLLTVDVPAGAHEVELAWSPPAAVPSALAALLGAALAMAHASRVRSAGAAPASPTDPTVTRSRRLPPSEPVAAR